MPNIHLNGLKKVFGGYTAVSDVNLKIADGEYVTLLGPSGCGKTTILRMMAGLIDPTEGDIQVDGSSVLSVEPHDRGIGYLFQNYALFPHMSAIENVGYGLLVRGDHPTHIQTKSSDMLRMANMLEWAGYMPHELSGGMQQRVALARSLAAGFKTLFLDEPMSSLDPKISHKLRYEIKCMAKKMGLTVVHVTHDQSIAMSISDRVIVMRRGRIAQVGTPKEIYYKPSCPYVAHFIGESNFMHAKQVSDNEIVVGGQTLTVEEMDSTGEDMVAAIRPEKIIFEKRLDNTFDGVISKVKFLGPLTRFTVDIGGQLFTVSTAKHPELMVGSKVSIYLPPEEIMLFSGIKDLAKELQVL